MIFYVTVLVIPQHDTFKQKFLKSNLCMYMRKWAICMIFAHMRWMLLGTGKGSVTLVQCSPQINDWHLTWIDLELSVGVNVLLLLLPTVVPVAMNMQLMIGIIVGVCLFLAIIIPTTVFIIIKHGRIILSPEAVISVNPDYWSEGRSTLPTDIVQYPFCSHFFSMLLTSGEILFKCPISHDEIHLMLTFMHWWHEPFRNNSRAVFNSLWSITMHVPYST